VADVDSSGDQTGAVELVDVVKMFGDFTAVDRINLSVRPGEFISLLGPSGCGKTTTLRMLAGFEEPTSGELRISGQPIAGTPPHKRDVNTVFQAYALFPHMSVAENVAYGLRQKSVGKADMALRVAEALDMVKMRPLADRRPRQLSGGQQQRVALARALVNRPSLLLLDEPLGALDRKLREEMQIELKLLQSQLGITFIFVTHDQEEAMAMSDRIVILRDGRIEQVGTPLELYERPVNRFVAEFLGRANFIEGTVEASNGAAFTLKTNDNLVAIAATDASPQLGERVTLALRPERIRFVNGANVNPDWNRVSGSIVSGTFTGIQHSYVIDTPIGLLTVVIPSFGHGAPRTIGSSAIVEWPPEAVIPITG
jgi:spermidine/putrescine transport system ATP-binding protein